MLRFFTFFGFARNDREFVAVMLWIAQPSPTDDVRPSDRFEGQMVGSVNPVAATVRNPRLSIR